MRFNTMSATSFLVIYCLIISDSFAFLQNGPTHLVLSSDSANSRRSKNYPTLSKTNPSGRTEKSWFRNIPWDKLLSNIFPVDPKARDFDGFEFVDSPESSDSRDLVTSAERIDEDSRDYLSRTVNENGVVEKEQIDENGIIHVVHVSRVHPQIMADGGTQESTNTSSDSTSGYYEIHGGSVPSPAKNNVSPRMLASSSPTIVDNSMNDYTTHSTPFTDGITSLSVEQDTFRSNTSIDARLATTVENKKKVQEVSTTSKEQCLGNCISKKTESNIKVNDSSQLPVCLPLLFNSTLKGNLSYNGSNGIPAVTPSSADMVKVRHLNGGEGLEGMLQLQHPNLPLNLKLETLTTAPNPRFSQEDVCLSEDCVRKAASLLSRLDKSANPCDSFYKFACGGYMKNEMLPRSVFSEISSNIVARMNSILKTPVNALDTPAVRSLKTFFNKCLITSSRDLLREALHEIGGWPSPTNQPVFQNTWGEIAFTMIYGMFFEYNLVSINLTFVNETSEWILNVDYPHFVKVALSSGTLETVLDEIERDIKKVAISLEIENYTYGIADMRTFMAEAIKYAKATYSPSSNRAGLYSLEDLTTRFVHLDVFKRLPSLLEAAVAIDVNELIYVSNIKYLEKVDELIRDTTVKTQEIHLVLMIIRSLSSLIGTEHGEKRCGKLTGALFPHIYRNLYSSTYVSDFEILSAERIVSNIRRSFLNLLDQNLDGTIKYAVMDKVQQLNFIWSNRKEICDDLNATVESFLDGSTFLSYVKTRIRSLKLASYAYLHKSVNGSLPSFLEQYSERYQGVNAFYFDGNSFIAPAVVHEGLFNPGLPLYVSYGGLGSIVGHELFHSVNNVEDLVLSNSFRNMERCMINQFDQYSARNYKSNVRMNGVMTKEDNIADYSGFMVAYRAFSEINNRSEDRGSKRLPGLQMLNANQMFWLSAASNWCRQPFDDNGTDSIDNHAPPDYRIDGQFSNIAEFARDFNCPENSPMNPQEKCSLFSKTQPTIPNQK